jgi:hypothetical protein
MILSRDSADATGKTNFGQLLRANNQLPVVSCP